MEMEDFIIRLFKAHFMIHPPIVPSINKKEDDEETNIICNWLCVDGRPIFHDVDFHSIEGKHLLYKIKTFIYTYSEMEKVDERKEKTLFKILAKYPLPFNEVDEMKRFIKEEIIMKKPSLSILRFYEQLDQIFSSSFKEYL